MSDIDIKGLKALERIAQTINGQNYSGAHKLRSILRSLYNGQETDLSVVTSLDYDLRKDLAAVIVGIGHGGFPDYKIREAFVRPGDTEARWFLNGK